MAPSPQNNSLAYTSSAGRFRCRLDPNGGLRTRCSDEELRSLLVLVKGDNHVEDDNDDDDG